MALKLAKNWRFWGIDIKVFMGDLSTLSLSLVLVAALFRQLEGPKEIHKQTHMVHCLFLDLLMLFYFHEGH